MLDKSMADVTEVDVLSALDELKNYYKRRNDEIRKDVELYNRDYSLKVPAGIIEVRTHSTKTICDRGADRVGSGRLQVHMEPRRPGRKEEQRVEKMEKAGAALFYLARKRAKYNPVRALGLHGFNRGAMVAKFQLDSEGWDDAPDRANFDSDLAFKKASKLWQYRQYERFPMMIDARPIEAIYPDTETDGDNFVIEHYHRKVGDIKKNYPQWSEHFGSLLSGGYARKGKSKIKKYADDTIVEYVEVWTREWRGVIVEGAWCPIGDFPAGPIPNLYGRPPYFIRYTFGDPTGKPEEKCSSILRPIRDEAQMESRMMTVVQAVAETGAYGATVINSKDDAAKATIQFGPGAVIESDMPDGQRPTPLVQANRLGDALQALQVAQGAVSEGAVPSEARGAAAPGRGGTPSGVAAALLTGQASMVIAPVKDAMEDLISDMLPFIFYVLDVVWDGKLKLYGQVGSDQFVDIELDSEVIDGHYAPVYVDLRLNKIENEQAAYNLGIQAAATGKFPDAWIMETFFGVENADAMLEDAHANRIANSDEVDAYLKARLIEKLQAKAAGKADAIPGSTVPAPAGAPAQVMPADGMAGPPLDPMMQASMGQTQVGPGAAGMVAPPVMG